jgi:asparagine synthase (glutamine-hydrolysing)
VDSVRHHLVADVPVGAFLSSGIDSGALVGLMRDAGQEKIKTITVAFDEFQGKAEDESPLAAETARTYGAEHYVRRVTRSEFLSDLPRLLEAMDQPTADGINTWFVAKAAAEHGLKVAMSGLGGDELFGGYPSFRDIPRWVQTLWLPSRVPGAAVALRALPLFLFPGANPKMRGLFQYGGSYAGAWFLKRGIFMPWDLPTMLDPDTIHEGLRRLQLQSHLGAMITPDPGTPFGRVATLESSLYMRNQLLRDTDWASMAHSLEVRVPYVDPVLLSTIARYAQAEKLPYKAALISSPLKPLPEAITHRAKTGFTTPIPQWLQEHSDLNLWRRVAQLRTPACPWARRWSHVIGSRFAALPA